MKTALIAIAVGAIGVLTLILLACGYALTEGVGWML